MLSLRLANKQNIALTEDGFTGTIAGQYFDEGYNCAQAVIMSAAQALGIDVPHAVVRGAASFTGGIGYAGCTCGALVGASLLIGMISADLNSPRKSRNTLDLSGRFHDIFRDNFKVTCCRSLRNGKHFRNKEVRRKCREITVRTSELLVEMLANNPLALKKVIN